MTGDRVTLLTNFFPPLPPPTSDNASVNLDENQHNLSADNVDEDLDNNQHQLGADSSQNGGGR